MQIIFITLPCYPNCSNEDEGMCHNLTCIQLGAKAVATVRRGEKHFRIDGVDESHTVFTLTCDCDWDVISTDQRLAWRWFCSRDFDSQWCKSVRYSQGFNHQWLYRRRWSKLYTLSRQQEHWWSGLYGPEYCHLPHLNLFLQVVVASLRIPNGCCHTEGLADWSTGWLNQWVISQLESPANQSEFQNSVCNYYYYRRFSLESAAITQ